MRCGPGHWRRGERHMSPNKLYRDPANGIFRGVCAGIADYFGISVGLVRILTVLGVFVFSFPVVIGYLVLGFVLDPKPSGLYRSPDEESFWRRARVDPKGTVSDIQQKFRDVERRIREAEAYVTSSEFRLNRDFKEL